MVWKTALLAIAALAAGIALGRAMALRPQAELATAVSFRWALEEQDWLTRSYRLSAFLQHLSPENLDDALQVLQRHLPWLDTDELRLFMFAWARFDPQGALEHALAWPTQSRRNGCGAAIYAWAFRDPQAALRALETVEDPELREFMEGRLVAGWTHGQERGSAQAFIAELPDGPRRSKYVGMLAWELARQGPDAVLRWVEGVSDDDPRYKTAVFLKASSALSGVDAASTARWLEAHVERPHAAGAVRVLARSWAASDPPAAMQWLTALPPGPNRRAATFSAFRVWIDQAPEDAEQWLRGATPARALDPAVRFLVGRKRRDAPVDALRWALAIDEPALREEVAVDVGRAWLRRDAETARAWLAGSRLSPEVLAAIAEGDGSPGDQGTARGPAATEGPVSP